MTQAVLNQSENIGLAIYNPNDAPELITLKIYTPYASPKVYRTVAIVLAPGQKISKFLDELFPGLPPDDGSGQPLNPADYITIESADPISITAVRTDEQPQNFLMGYIPIETY